MRQTRAKTGWRQVRGTGGRAVDPGYRQPWRVFIAPILLDDPLLNVGRGRGRLSAVILLGSTFLYRLLRDRGLIAVERLMGMLLVMVAVQMFMDGVKAFLAR